MMTRVPLMMLVLLMGVVAAGRGEAGGEGRGGEEKRVEGTEGGGEQVEEATPEGEWTSETVFVYHAEAWRLEVTYLAIGTRSEGQQGLLLKDGKPVVGEKVGESLLTPLGLLKFYGEKRQKPWDVTGWHFADRRKILVSEDMPRRTPPEPVPELEPAEEIKPEGKNNE